jgi:hypothetical protein
MGQPGNRQRRDREGPHAPGIKCFRNLRMFMEIPSGDRNFMVLYFLLDSSYVAAKQACSKP